MQQVYHCAIDKELFAAKIEEAERYVKDLRDGTITVSREDFTPNALQLGEVGNWVLAGEGTTFRTDYSPETEALLEELNIAHQTEWSESLRTAEIRQRVDAVKRWYLHDWGMLDNKIRSSIVEGISVFLSIFDLPDVARVFCPPPPPKRTAKEAPQKDEQPGIGMRLRQSLPPLDELIESGKVLALNMPAGTTRRWRELSA